MNAPTPGATDSLLLPAASSTSGFHDSMSATVSSRDVLRSMLLPIATTIAHLRERRWRGVRFLCYHSVVAVEDMVALESRTLAISIAGFRRHLDLMARANYRLVSMREALRLLAAGTEGQFVCLTFDDGRIDNFTTAWPLLREAGHSAHFFVSSNLIGTGIHYRHNGRDCSDLYMDAHALRAIVREGGSVGSHARHHQDLRSLDDRSLSQELRDSRYELEEITAGKVTTLAYPYASYDKRVVAATHAAGYRYAFGIRTGTVTSLKRPLTLARSVIRSGTDVLENDAILRGGMDFTSIYSALKSRLRLSA